MRVRVADAVGCAVAAAMLCALVGCPPANSPAIQADDPADPGLVYVFPGIEGSPIWFTDARRGYRDAGVTAEIRLFDWGRPLNTLANLTHLEENREKAQTCADELAAWRHKHPKAPLHVVGYSGGGGMALLTLERLPEGVSAQSVALVQPAVSPRYDLDAAVRHVEGSLTNFYSPSDGFILGWGTTVFGTIDRCYGPSAGKLGFSDETLARSKQVGAKVRQIAWSPEWLAAGHWGTHIGMLGYVWNREILAPLLLGENRESRVQ
ncbi:MAG: hypothetical protein HZB38_11050 [Planctomycetes bacterium]|nr:hypothetical protein [Planctomycetota bacterium]